MSDTTSPEGPDQPVAPSDRARKAGAGRFRIFRAGPQDASLLADLGAETFRSAFAGTTAANDIEDYVRRHFSPDIQRRELSIPDALVFVAAATRPAGYVQVIPDRETSSRAAQLRRLYLLPAYHGSGAADRLMTMGIEESRRTGFVRMWLSCWEKNHRALAFYRRWGFVETGRTVFPVGEDRQLDIVLSRAL
jgi:ribosomal protein S18 acetylase RimI-like enzyme